MYSHIILTPIAHKVKPNGIHADGTRNREILDSKRDYDFQELRVQNHDINMKWHDAPANNAQMGNILIFVFNNVGVRIHYVEDIIHYQHNWQLEEIPEGWRDRNTLSLSYECRRFTWTEWIAMGGYPVKNTMYVDKHRQELMTNIENELLVD